MKIAYNPLSSPALSAAPTGNDITFDLPGISIYSRGVRFKGTDTTYNVFKKHTSSGSGGYNGLVPVPSFTTTLIRYLREDGTWQVPSDLNTDTKVLQSVSTTSTFRPLILGLTESADINVLIATVTGLTYVANAIYAQPSTASLFARTFVGALKGNADTSTSLGNINVGNPALPVYFSAGKPVACTASSLFSNLTNSGNNISVTVAGLNRLLTVAYASRADRSNVLQCVDIRNITPTPADKLSNSVTSWFNQTGTPDTGWWGGITVKGWTDVYEAWEIAGPATSTNSKRGLFFRSGSGPTWNAWERILTSANTYLNTSTGVITINNVSATLSLGSHTHKYAGSNYSGGPANSAVRLDGFYTAGGLEKPNAFGRGLTLQMLGSGQFSLPGGYVDTLIINSYINDVPWCNALIFPKNGTARGFIVAQNPNNADWGTKKEIGTTGNISLTTAGVLSIFGVTSTLSLSSHTHPLSAITDLNASWDAILKVPPSAYITRWPSWGEVTGKPGSFVPSAHEHNHLLINNTETKNVGRFQMFQTTANATINPDTGWWSVLRAQHGGYTAGYWQELALSFSSDRLQFRRNINGAMTPWVTLLHNVNSSLTTTTDSVTIKINNVSATIPTLGFNDRKYVTLSTPQTITGVKTFTTLLKFNVANGTSPFTVVSNTLVNNLNADLWRGLPFERLYIPAGALLGVSGTVATKKVELVNYFNNYGTGVGANATVSTSLIQNWNTDSTALYNSSVYSMIKIGGGYNGTTYGQWLLSSYNLTSIGVVGRADNVWSGIKWLAYTTDNVASATRLQTARNINGTLFNGTADITTSRWGYARTLSLTGSITGSATIDGSGNVSIATTYQGGNIGNLDSRYVNITGDTMVGYLNINTSGVYIKFGCQNGSYAHYETSASSGHYFNKSINVNGQIRVHNTGTYMNATGFYKNGSSDSYLLLGGGSHKLISDFSTSSHVHNFDLILDINPGYLNVGAFKRRSIVGAGTTSLGYMTRIALGVESITNNFNNGLISVGTNDAGTTWTDFRFRPNGDFIIDGLLYSTGVLKAGSSNAYVLLGGGGHNILSSDPVGYSLVLRTSGGYVNATYFNSAIGDENSSPIGSVYVRNTTDNYIRRVSHATFINSIVPSLNSKYLPLTGGTMTGGINFNTNNNGNANVSAANGFKLFYNHTSGTNFAGSYTNVASFMTGYTGFQLSTYGGNNETLHFRKYQDNGVWHPWHSVLHTGNYTSTLDGRYVNISGDTMTGTLYGTRFEIQTNGYFVTSSGWFQNNTAGCGLYNAALDARWRAQNGRWEADKPILSTGYLYGTYLQSSVATGTAPLLVNSSTKVAGLNADYLDGYHADINQTPNTIVIRNSSGYTYHNYIHSNTSNSENLPILQFITTNGTDGFYRKSSVDHVVNALYRQTDGLSRGGYAAYIAAGTAAARWVRIAKYTSYVSYGDFTITNNYSNNHPQGVKFTVNTSYRSAPAIKITQLGGVGTLFTDVRVVFPTATDEAGFIEVYYNTSSVGNILYITLSSTFNMELMPTYTAGALPSTHAVKGFSFVDGLAGNIVQGYNHVYGGIVHGTGTAAQYATLAFEARGNGVANTVRPGIGFHQPGVYAGSLEQVDANTFQFLTQGRGRAHLQVNNLYAAGLVQGDRIYSIYDSGVAGSISCSNWFRGNGNSGWLNSTHSGGIYMADSTWVRIYNNKQFYVSSAAALAIKTEGGIHSGLLTCLGTANIAGTITASNGIITDYDPGTWLSMATRSNLIVGSQNQTASSAHALYRVKNVTGSAIVFGGLGTSVGFYGFTKAGIDAGTNGSAWSTTWNVDTGNLIHTDTMTVRGMLTASGGITGNLTGIADKAYKSDLLEAYTASNFTSGGHYLRAIRNASGWATRLYMGYYRDATLQNTVSVSYADSSNYATSAGNADTVDGIHANSFALKSLINSQVGGTKSAQMLWSSWNNSDAYGGAIQIREYGNVGAAQSVWLYAPRLTFHWGNRTVKGFGLRYDGQFAVDDVPISLSTHNHNSTYVTALSTSGNYLTWTRNGTVNNITIPYATNADMLDGYHVSSLFRNFGTYNTGLVAIELSGSSSWATTTGGFQELYGNSLHIRGNNTWNFRLDFGTNSNIYLYSGINTTVMTYRGELAFTSQILNPANYYWANIKVSTSSSASTSPTFSTAYTSNWFRTTGATGWYSETYGGGIYMTDANMVRIYSNKVLYNDGVRQWGIGGHQCGLKLYSSTNVGINLANSAFTWGIYSNSNGNMYIGRRTGNVDDGSGVYYHTLTISNIQSPGFYHTGIGSNSYVLLAGGGYKALSTILSEYDSRYVNITGDTMTGVLKIDEIHSVNGNGLVQYNGGNCILAPQTGTTYIRSGTTNLMHRKNGTDYTIWDAVNSNLDTINWTCKNLYINNTIRRTTGEIILLSMSDALLIGESANSHLRLISTFSDSFYMMNKAGKSLASFSSNSSTIASTIFNVQTSDSWTIANFTKSITNIFSPTFTCNDINCGVFRQKVTQSVPRVAMVIYTGILWISRSTGDSIISHYNPLNLVLQCTKNSTASSGTILKIINTRGLNIKAESTIEQNIAINGQQISTYTIDGPRTYGLLTISSLDDTSFKIALADENSLHNGAVLITLTYWGPPNW